jgi:hypothetical protein
MTEYEQIYCIVSSAMSVCIFKSSSLLLGSVTVQCALSKFLFYSTQWYFLLVSSKTEGRHADPLLKYYGQEKVLFTCLLQPPTHTPSPIPPPPASLGVLG